jgi:hypothetical protein
MNNKSIILSKKPKEDRKNPNIAFDISHNIQIEMINKLYMSVDFELKNVMLRELETKRNSYKQQDIKKDKYDESLFISLNDIIEMLVGCKLKCHYCNCHVKIIYKMARDEKQWTLDRIDNDDGHSHVNTIVSCLDCNLKRRCINKDKFVFTKKLSISRVD